MLSEQQQMEGILVRIPEKHALRIGTEDSWRRGKGVSGELHERCGVLRENNALNLIGRRVLVVPGFFDKHIECVFVRESRIDDSRMF